MKWSNNWGGVIARKPLVFNGPDLREGYNPAPGGLQQFIQSWQTRTLPHGSAMQAWPSEWPLLELMFTLLTWIPALQHDPEGQVYLEAITRAVAEAGQFASLGSRLLHGTAYDDASVAQAIREVFENIASGNVDVDEEIMPYVPRSFFPIMTVHQAKGLEFPMVIVDVGSDYTYFREAIRDPGEDIGTLNC